MKLSPSQEAANFAATKELPRISWNPRVITVFTRALHWSYPEPVLSNPN
jgi:hypothetical protein